MFKTGLLVILLFGVIVSLLVQRHRLQKTIQRNYDLLDKHDRERRAVLLYLNRIAEPFHEHDISQSESLDVVVDFMIEMTQATAGVCYLYDEKKKTLCALSIRGMFPPLNPATPYVLTKKKYLEDKVRSEIIQMGEGLIGEVALKQQPVLIMDPSSDSRIPRAALDMIPFNCIMVAPLASKKRTLGVLAVIKSGQSTDAESSSDVHKVSTESFTQDDLDMLSALGDQAASSIEMFRIFHSYAREEAERRAIEKELGLAREFQQTLLPAACPAVPGYDIAVFSRAAREVGGDYYDVFWVDENQRYLGVVVADVSGKGIPGAFVMAMTKAALRVLSKNRLNPEEVLLRCNDRLYEDTKESVFVTITYGLLDTSTGAFRYIRAGHEPLLKYGKNPNESVQQEEPSGLALGMVSTDDLHGILEEHTTYLRPGETMLLYTDGVVEAENESGAEFGRDTFVNFVSENRNDSPAELLHHVVDRIDTFSKGVPQHDDITLVAIRFHDNLASAQASATSMAPV